jgi:Phosphopantetheine attachment site
MAGAGASLGGMTDRQPDPALDLAARALAVVLDLEADDLRADSPLDDLGADAVARVQWADVVEELALADGRSLDVPDDVLAAATTLGDLAVQLSARPDDSAPGRPVTHAVPS